MGNRVRTSAPRLQVDRLRTPGPARASRRVGTVLDRGHHIADEASMASEHVATGQRSTEVLERYLGELSARLHGPRRARSRVVAEVHDGLAETIDAHVAGGTTADAAASAAIAEFGDPATVASSFADELATASARRTVATFIATGPLVGIWWLLLLHPAPWRTGI